MGSKIGKAIPIPAKTTDVEIKLVSTPSIQEKSSWIPKPSKCATLEHIIDKNKPTKTFELAGNMHVNGYVLLVLIVAGKTNSVSVTGSMNSSFVLPLIVFGEGIFNVSITLEIQAQHPVISSTEYMIALGGKVIPPFNLSLDESHGLNIPTQDIEVIYIIRNAVYVIEQGSIIKNDMLDSWLEDAMISMNVIYETLAPMAVYPIGSLGNEYKVITYCQILGKCFISITTLPDITVEVKVALPETRKSNRKIEVTFHNTKYGSGETILFEISGNYTAILECACDLTGTYISSNGTIAVFTGGRDTVVKRGKTKNTLITQMLPLSTWGKEFTLIDSDIDDFGDTIRVISRYNNTVVKMDGFKTVTIHAMSHFIIQRSLQRGSTIYLSANKPVMVCQIAADGFMQPAMINIPPAEHYFTTKLSIPCKHQYHMNIVVNGYNETFQLKERTEIHIELVSKSGFSVMHFESTNTNDICEIQNNGISFAIEDVDTNTLPKKQDNSKEINDTTEDICIDSDDCTEPTAVYINSYINQNTSWAVGGNVTMACNDGYTLIGNDVIICQNNSEWQTDVFICANDCPDPRTALHAPHAMVRGFTDQSSKAFACKCPCRRVGNPRYENVTKEVVQKIKDETEKDLAVQKNLTSTYVRKRKSAKDDRPAAKSIGVFGILSSQL
ncbi:unnamed protein product [Mytilus edulis]|uniref:Sushi domain-containing protein n=1 Tax=Mytilus edulis TaxID=6550 RepID=A0A8S3R6K1_MYTED|nr:unnamed protein product [Mytilus edulis]